MLTVVRIAGSREVEAPIIERSDFSTTFGDLVETVDGEILEDLAIAGRGPGDLDPLESGCVAHTNLLAQRARTKRTAAVDPTMNRAARSVLADPRSLRSSGSPRLIMMTGCPARSVISQCLAKHIDTASHERRRERLKLLFSERNDVTLR